MPGADEGVQLTGGPRLSVHGGEGPLRPFLLVHDAGADAHSWDAVAGRLVSAGHQVAAVDLRGHGRSEVTPSGYDTDTCADDLSTLLEQLGFSGGRSAVVAGHGWGANVALSLAARRDGVAGVACVAGGWTRPAWRYPTFDAAWAALTREDPAPAAGEPGSPRDEPEQARLRAIARSVFLGEPRAWYPLVDVPVLLCPVVPPDGAPDPEGHGSATRTGVAEATARLPRARVSWYYGGAGVLDTEVARLTDDLLALATTAEPAVT